MYSLALCHNGFFLKEYQGPEVVLHGVAVAHLVGGDLQVQVHKVPFFSKFCF